MGNTASEKRRSLAARQYTVAQRLAREAGLRLTQGSYFHYRLEQPGGWMMNIYPGNCRIQDVRNDNRPPAPYLGLPKPFTLIDVIDSIRDGLDLGSVNG